jgi:CRISPR/Cas system CSM-associated protein Csm3 (group 7 of RAMP superfamily)
MTKERMSREHRHIVERIIVKGTLELTSPTCLSNGDTDSPVDIALQYDSISNHALLTGTSIAGALRNHLRDYEHGYGATEQPTDLAALLFGGTRQDPEGDQSPLIVHDAVSDQPPTIEWRDGVRIDGTTGTAKINERDGEITGGAKYDFELLVAGTKFPLTFELLIDEKYLLHKNVSRQNLLEALAIALSGLENSEINLGMRKRRGFGCCVVANWDVWQFNLRNDEHRMAWLTFGRPWATQYSLPATQGKIIEALNISISKPDQRHFFELKASFSLDGSLLIRSGQINSGAAPDVVHLRSWRNGEAKPILSGTSLAGVLRHRAERIVNTIGQDSNLVKRIFGEVSEDEKTAESSRMIVHESIIENSADLVQNRIAIDRFTGGAYHGALLNEQPVWGNDNTKLKIELELRNPEDYEIGLLLLLLKDLWTGDLPVGGESSIGRGRLKGKKATLTRYQPGDQMQKCEITQGDQYLEIDNPDDLDLEAFVKSLVDEVSKAVAV